MLPPVREERTLNWRQYETDEALMGLETLRRLFTRLPERAAQGTATEEFWFDPVRLRAESVQAELIRDLRDYFGGNRGVPARPRRAWTVRLFLVPELALTEDSMAELPAVELENGHRGRRLLEARRVLVGNLGTQSAILVDRDLRTALVLGRNRETLLYDGRKTIRNILTFEALRDEGVMIHAACGALSGGGVLIMGERDKGKSTMLAALLTSSSFAYLGNDKLLAREKGGYLVACGWPTKMGIGIGTASRITSLKSFLGPRAVSEIARMPIERLWTDKRTIMLEPGEIETIFAVRRVRQATVRWAVFPDLHFSHPGTRIERMAKDEAAERFAENVLGIGGDRHFNFDLFDWLGLDCEATSRMETRVKPLAKVFANTVECYRLEGNADLGQAAEKVAQITQR